MNQDTDFNIGIDKPDITIHKKTGCGSVYCIFVEHYNQKFNYLLIRGAMSKDTPCGESWLWGISKLLTYALRRAFEEEGGTVEEAIMKQLLFHSCNRYNPATEKSCISAIGRALGDYLKLRNKRDEKEKTEKKEEAKV